MAWPRVEFVLIVFRAIVLADGSSRNNFKTLKEIAFHLVKLHDWVGCRGRLILRLGLKPRHVCLIPGLVVNTVGIEPK